ADLLVRHVEPVVAAEGDEEVVARDAGDRSRLEAEQLADAVVLVDDIVARAQVGERLKRPPDRCGPPRRALAEELRVRQERDAEIAPDEAAAGRADSKKHLRLAGEHFPWLDDSGLRTPE